MKLFEVDPKGEYYPLATGISFIDSQNKWQAQVNPAGVPGSYLEHLTKLLLKEVPADERTTQV